MSLEVTIDPAVQDLGVGLVEANGITMAAANAELRSYCDAVAGRVRTAGLPGGEVRRKALRELLRHGGYKPSGRNKPAQEYLLRTAEQAGSLPEIFAAVDLLNGVSVEFGLPISLVSLTRLGTILHLRYGRPGEQFVFNQGGQELDVEGLLCLCAGDASRSQPVGSPVKDSMAGKLTTEDTHVLACIYAARSAISADVVQAAADKLAAGFQQYCGATSAFTQRLPESW